MTEDEEFAVRFIVSRIWPNNADLRSSLLHIEQLLNDYRKENVKLRTLRIADKERHEEAKLEVAEAYRIRDKALIRLKKIQDELERCHQVAGSE